MGIREYCPSINEVFLNKALKVGMNKEEMEITKLARIAVLSNRNKLWVRIDSRDRFDMPISVSDSAEASDLVGIYLLI